ncbi:MAG: PEP-CTERM sorting domain-containing protein [Proteobacteria bacterium]|uniref:PEP-CTERM sorting domain-containing protein n=1 Tax=Aquabacterium sp. TaxID=1872578 RepID=UPI0035C78A6B|nr:PEP-CTERM sorting domain-containing protein [Pseudomonadota bacterium]
MLVKSSIAAAIALSLLSPAQAGTVVSAVNATVLSGGSGETDIADTYNLFGLFTDYVSGVTDYDAYFATNPLHDTAFEGQEWFSNPGTTSASVAYDLGSVQTIQGLAFWNEDGTGVGQLNVLGSTDGISWFNLLSNLTPTNNPFKVSYGADLYNWAPTALRYVRLDMSACPQDISDAYIGCAVGEVAFNAASNIPEPSTFALSLLGLAATAALRRRKDA